MAAQFVDLLWPVFLLAGVERVEIDPGNTVVTPLAFVHYPFTHSLLAVILWAVLFGGIHFVLRRNGRDALLLGGLVSSHWFLDLVVHRPDLPLLPGSNLKVGLGAWNSLPLTLLIEVPIFVLGAFLYVRATRPLNRTGTFALWGLLAFLGAIYAANVLGPPPASAGPIAVVGLSQWLLVAWAYWADRNRRVYLTRSVRRSPR